MIASILSSGLDRSQSSSSLYSKRIKEGRLGRQRPIVISSTDVAGCETHDARMPHTLRPAWDCAARMI